MREVLLRYLNHDGELVDLLIRVSGFYPYEAVEIIITGALLMIPTLNGARRYEVSGSLKGGKLNLMVVSPPPG
ncbi:MAG: hypothetical protein HY459_00770 [Parcubacteria group bacterium]|nr:hypothetical protein [Parcubacteria group bacterium]